MVFMGLTAVLAVIGGASAVGFALWKCCTSLSNRHKEPSKPSIGINLTDLTAHSNIHTAQLTRRNPSQENSAEK